MALQPPQPEPEPDVGLPATVRTTRRWRPVSWRVFLSALVLIGVLGLGLSVLGIGVGFALLGTFLCSFILMFPMIAVLYARERLGRRGGTRSSRP